MKETGSYHDVAVIVNGVTHKISNNYAYHLMCTRTGGWELWSRWDKKEELIGGEFNGDDFEIKINDLTILKVNKTDDQARASAGN